MAQTQVESNNKLIKFTQQINREFVRENMFSPYMSEGMDAIIRIRSELKDGGEDMNIPIVTRLKGQGVATGTLVGNEEKVDNYGMRLRLEWARHAVAMTKAEKQKDSADIFGVAKPLLSDWGKELQRDELIAAFMALPTDVLPTSSGGVRVNGIQYDLATSTQLNLWDTDNGPDRILYGDKISNRVAGNHASSLSAITTTMKLSAATLSLGKRLAKLADPHIRPYKTRDGYEYYVGFAGTNSFRDLKIDAAMLNANKDARAREGNGMDRNPLFQDGDLLYDGVIVREVPEISSFVTNVWQSLRTAGNGSTRVEPIFLCGQQAAVFGWGQMAQPTFRKEDDYGFITGTGIEMAYGVAKMFKKHPAFGSPQAVKQWGVVTMFASAAADV